MATTINGQAVPPLPPELSPSTEENEEEESTEIEVDSHSISTASSLSSPPTSILPPCPLIGAIDQGTSSSRFLIFSAETGEKITYHQIEMQKIYPNEGWVEQNPVDILQTVLECIEVVARKLNDLGFDIRRDVRCVGLTNQRESTILWNRKTGKALYNSIVWLDNRTHDLVERLIDRIPGRDINWLKNKTGLPISTYFSALKIKWLIENVPEVKQTLTNGDLLFGNVDSWLLWNLTGQHRTDVTNASRTLLMDLETLSWDPFLCDFFNIPITILPEIKSSADQFGTITDGPLAGIDITGVIGDQNAALVGQHCLDIGQAKVTYGTGAFLMQNIGPGPLHGALKLTPKEARRKLLTTVAFKLSDRAAWYALEGSIASAGAAITWLRDNLELIKNYSEVEELAREDSSAGGLFFVPAFQGLYAPYWDSKATGTIIGISQFSRKCHLVRATLEGVAFQTNDILALMQGDDGPNLGIRVDGGMSSNNLLCQILADIAGIDIYRPKMAESTAFGAAMIAAYQAGLWSSFGSTKITTASVDVDTKLTSSIKQDSQTPSKSASNISIHQEQTSNNSKKTNGHNHLQLTNNKNGHNYNNNNSNGLANRMNGTLKSNSFDNDDHHNTFLDTAIHKVRAKLQRLSSLSSMLISSGTAAENNTNYDSNCNSIQTVHHNHNQNQNQNQNQTNDQTQYSSLSSIFDDPEKFDIFHPSIDDQVRVERIQTWRAAVSRSRKWIRIEHQEQKRVEYQRLSSIPFTAFVVGSVALCILSNLCR